MTTVSFDSSDLPSWASAARYFPVPENVAQFLVIGCGEVSLGKHGGGILAWCPDQLSAWRCAKEIKKDPAAEVMIVQNTAEIRKAVEMTILLQIAEAEEEREELAMTN